MLACHLNLSMQFQYVQPCPRTVHWTHRKSRAPAKFGVNDRVRQYESLRLSQEWKQEPNQEGVEGNDESTAGITERVRQKPGLHQHSGDQDRHEGDVVSFCFFSIFTVHQTGKGSGQNLVLHTSAFRLYLPMSFQPPGYQSVCRRQGRTGRGMTTARM